MEKLLWLLVEAVTWVIYIRALALAGAEVYMIGRDDKKLLKIATEIKKFNDKCFYKKLTLLIDSQVDTLINDINISSGELDMMCKIMPTFQIHWHKFLTVMTLDYQNSYNIVVTSVASVIKTLY